MNVYLKLRKNRLSKLDRRCLWTFGFAWGLAAILEFLALPVSLYAVLISLSIAPLSILVVSALKRLLNRPKLPVEESAQFKLRVNPKTENTDVLSHKDLERVGNYILITEPGVSVTEITRKSASELIQRYPELVLEKVSAPVGFKYTAAGQLVVNLSKGFAMLMVIITLLFGFEVYPYFSNIMMPWNRASAIAATTEWGGLAELPGSHWFMTIETEGSMFTRTFKISFRSNPDRIREWVEESYGIRDVIPVNDNGYTIYRSVGYKKSIGGTVAVDYETGRVNIEMSWS